MNLKQIKALAKIMSDYQLDFIEVEGIKIQKTRHSFPPLETIPTKETTPEEDEEDLLFYSS